MHCSVWDKDLLVKHLCVIDTELASAIYAQRSNTCHIVTCFKISNFSQAWSGWAGVVTGRCTWQAKRAPEKTGFLRAGGSRLTYLKY